MADFESMAVEAGCIAQETTNSDGLWTQIGANWAVSRTLLTEMQAQN